MNQKINWTEAGCHFLQNGIWHRAVTQRSQLAVTEWLRLSEIQYTDIRIIVDREAEEMEHVSHPPIIPILKLWQTVTLFEDTTSQGNPTDKRLIVVAPSREVAREGAQMFAERDEYPIQYVTPFTSFSFNEKEMAQLVAGKMPAITETTLFCYYDAQRELWVDPVQMVMRTL